MNIAILISQLSGGGAERIAKVLGDYYWERGENVYYFLGDYPQESVYSVNGEIVHTHVKPFSSSRLSFWGDFMQILSSAWKIRRLKKKYHIDVAISFMADFNTLNILSSHKSKTIIRICTILSERTDLHDVFYRKSLIHVLYPWADKIVVQSCDGVKELEENYKISTKNIEVIPNFATDVEYLHNSSENVLEWSFGRNAVIAVGRLSPIKQHDRILRAFRVVAERIPDAKLLFLGAGILEDYLKKLCQKYHLTDKVVFIGYTTHVKYYLQHSRVFVMASKSEAFPNSMIEAMDAGVPVVATASPGGIKDLVGAYEKKDAEILKKGFSTIEDKISVYNYGILTPKMPKEKLLPSSALVEEEIVMGAAISLVLENENLCQFLKKKSLERSRYYSKERIISKWNNIVYSD